MILSRKKLNSLKEELNSALQYVIAFWQTRSWDHQHGGFLTNFDERGNALETPEKYLNTQARLVWWFSKLQRHYPDNQAYKKLAEDGVTWMIEHLWDQQHGGWFWKVKRDGSPLVKNKLVYGQSFAIYALSEYALATNEPLGMDYAAGTFDLLQKYCTDTLYGGYYENLEPDWTLAPGGFAAGDRKSLDIHMHLMESFTVLAQASGLEIHRRKLLEVLHLIQRHMIDPVSGCGGNQYSLDFQPLPAIAIRHTWNAEREGDAPEIPTDTTSYGHNVELSWLMNRALKTLQVDAVPYQSAMRRLVDHALSHGVDWQYGGVYRDGLASGEALILEKEFWQNAEALVGFLDAYQTFGEAPYLEAFENCWNFVKQSMIIPGVGEWRTLLDRQGSPIDPKIGNPWKVAYHSGRALLECVNRLGELGGE
jgi:mannobiose 2-epimerase